MNKKILIIDGPLMEFYRARLEDGQIETYEDLKKKLYEYGRSIDCSISIYQTNSIDKIIEMLCKEVKDEYYDLIIVNTWLDNSYDRIWNTIEGLCYFTRETKTKAMGFAITRSDYQDLEDGKYYAIVGKTMFFKYIEAISKWCIDYKPSKQDNDNSVSIKKNEG